MRALIAGLVALWSGVALAEIPVDGPAEPTAAYVEFCRRMPDECVPAGGPSRELWTNELWQKVRRINSAVNNGLRPVTDRDRWGVEDRWDFPVDGFADCEDFALEKRRRLIAAGVSPRALLFAVVRKADGEGHLVLLLVTDRGAFVLDNLTDRVMVQEDTGLFFVMRQSAEDPKRWLRFRG